MVKTGRRLVALEFLIQLFFVSYLFYFFIILYFIYLFFEMKVFHNLQGSKLDIKKNNF